MLRKQPEPFSDLRLSPELIFEGFEELPDRYGDAVYYYNVTKADFIMYDWRVKHDLRAQQELKVYLLGEVEKTWRESRWAMLGPMRFWVTADYLGIKLIEPVALLPEPEENRLIGVDPTPSTNQFWEIIRAG